MYSGFRYNTAIKPELHECCRQHATEPAGLPSLSLNSHCKRFCRSCWDSSEALLKLEEKLSVLILWTDYYQTLFCNVAQRIPTKETLFYLYIGLICHSKSSLSLLFTANKERYQMIFLKETVPIMFPVL